MKRIAIITGASSGFGKEFAIQLDRMFQCIDEYWLIARNADNLKHTAEEIIHKTKILPMDLCDDDAADKIADAVAKEHAVVKILVNSAGFGKLGDVYEMNEKHISDMIKLNCSSLAVITKKLIPFMDDNSRIINLSSSAAFLPQPGFSVYAASKSFVLSFTRALNAELKSKEIYATAVCPGPSNTNFFNVAEESAISPWYKKLFMAPPEKVVALAIEDSLNMRELSVYGFAMKAFRLMTKYIPHRLFLKILR